MNENKDLKISLKERVIFFLKQHDVNFSEFARMSDTSPAFIRSIKKNIGIDKIQILKPTNFTV